MKPRDTPRPRTGSGNPSSDRVPETPSRKETPGLRRAQEGEVGDPRESTRSRRWTKKGLRRRTPTW